MQREPLTEDTTARIVAWLEQNVGGRVLRIARQPRWRPVWFADVERDGERLELCVRGDRTDMPLVFPLEHEMVLQRTMHEHGIPTPKVYGLIESPLAYVMDRVGGRNDFSDSTDAERHAAVDEYLQILARLHALPVEPFAQAGVMRAATPAESGTLGIRQYERLFRSVKQLPNPFIEFSLAWLRRNPPRSQGRESAIVWDSGQFHTEKGRIVAVLDVEIGHIGDPMMDLAAWRQRDTIIGYGDFKALYARYEALTGRPVDLDALMRHHFAFTLTNELAFSAALRHPAPDSDLMTNMQWCYETNLFATEALAEIRQIELPTIELPAPRESRGRVAIDHLVHKLRSLPVDDEFVQYQLRTMFRMARHVARADEIGDAVSQADLDDLHALLGHRPSSWLEGEAELERFVLADAESGRHDDALIPLFHKRHLRAHALLGPAGSAMTRHAKIQPFRG
jgi:aminoglycoside phosphotransferase (APT) family kinase protein